MDGRGVFRRGGNLGNIPPPEYEKGRKKEGKRGEKGGISNKREKLNAKRQ